MHDHPQSSQNALFLGNEHFSNQKSKTLVYGDASRLWGLIHCAGGKQLGSPDLQNQFHEGSLNWWPEPGFLQLSFRKLRRHRQVSTLRERQQSRSCVSFRFVQVCCESTTLLSILKRVAYWFLSGIRCLTSSTTAGNTCLLQRTRVQKTWSKSWSFPFKAFGGGGEREGGGGGEKEESSGEKGERILTEHVVPNLDLDFSVSTHHFLVDLKTLLVYYR